jgi:hypothetical protein
MASIAELERERALVDALRAGSSRPGLGGGVENLIKALFARKRDRDLKPREEEAKQQLIQALGLPERFPPSGPEQVDVGGFQRDLQGGVSPKAERLRQLAQTMSRREVQSLGTKLAFTPTEEEQLAAARREAEVGASVRRDAAIQGRADQVAGGFLETEAQKAARIEDAEKRAAAESDRRARRDAAVPTAIERRDALERQLIAKGDQRSADEELQLNQLRQRRLGRDTESGQGAVNATQRKLRVGRIAGLSNLETSRNTNILVPEKDELKELTLSNVRRKNAQRLRDSIAKQLTKRGSSVIGALGATKRVFEGARGQISSLMDDLDIDRRGLDRFANSIAGLDGRKNAQIRGQLIDLAFAVAKSREGGKLTNQDVEFAIQTLGGDLSSADAFKTNLIGAVNQRIIDHVNLVKHFVPDANLEKMGIKDFDMTIPEAGRVETSKPISEMSDEELLRIAR